MDNCPDITKLSEYFDDEMKGIERAKIEKHLLQCPKCRATIGYMKLIRNTFNGEPEKAPENLIENILSTIMDSKEKKELFIIKELKYFFKESFLFISQHRFEISALAILLLIITFSINFRKNSKNEKITQRQLINKGIEIVPHQLSRVATDTKFNFVSGEDERIIIKSKLYSKYQALKNKVKKAKGHITYINYGSKKDSYNIDIYIPRKNNIQIYNYLKNELNINDIKVTPIDTEILNNADKDRAVLVQIVLY